MSAFRSKARIVNWCRRSGDGVVSAIRRSGGAGATVLHEGLLSRISVAGMVAIVSVCLGVASAAAANECRPTGGCVPRENGSNARWWADSAVKGRCGSQTDTDWLVTYKVDNSTWRRADPDKIRFYASEWSMILWPWPVGSTKAATTDPRPPGVTLCFSGPYPKSHVMATWIWLKK